MPVFAGGGYAGVFDGQRVGFSGEGGEGGRYLGQAGPDVGGHGAHGACSSPVVLVAGVGFGDGEAEVPLDPGQDGMCRIQCMLICWVRTHGRTRPMRVHRPS